MSILTDTAVVETSCTNSSCNAQAVIDLGFQTVTQRVIGRTFTSAQSFDDLGVWTCLHCDHENDLP
jgi:hypothetical protein